MDFIVAITIGIGLSSIVFIISYGLSLIEILQYTTFSASRNYYASHLTQEAQREAGLEKFERLRANPTFQPMFATEWVELIGSPEFRDFGDEYGYTEGGFQGNSSRFEGGRLNIQLNLLAVNIPILGSSGDREVFQTFITSFVGRQPSVAECKEHVQGRFEVLRNLEPGFSALGINDSSYVGIEDNGC